MNAARTTGLVLCGGASSRMRPLGEAVDKGLLPLRDRPLVQHAIDRLRPQVGQMLISANTRLEDYRGFGFPLVQDAQASLDETANIRVARPLAGPRDSRAQRHGPLAGIVAALQAIADGQVPAAGADSALDDRWLATVPCDSPDFPVDLVAQLACGAGGADLAFARTPRGRHPVFALIRLRVRHVLFDAFARGERRLGAAFAAAGAVPVLFGSESAFLNLNTPQELASAALSRSGEVPS